MTNKKMVDAFHATTHPIKSDKIGASELSDLLCCDACGGKMVYIRGRHPGMEKRIVCPTCMAETLDDIKGRLSDDYGRAYQAT